MATATIDDLVVKVNTLDTNTTALLTQVVAIKTGLQASVDGSATSATAAATSATEAIGSASTAATQASAATTQASAAAASAAAALTSQSAASSSASAASTSQTAAAASAAAALSSQNASSASAAAALSSQTDAASSATAASGSATAAATQATSATASKNAAAASETNAAASAASALAIYSTTAAMQASADGAAASATSATASATAASTSEANALSSKNAAATSAASAASSATAASGSAGTATTQATNASNSASASAVSATAAASSAAGAVASADAALASKGLADTSAANAVTSASGSAASASASATSASAAAASQAKAAQWADANQDIEVEAGKFSAKHWAAQAQASATGSLVYRGAWDAGLLAYPATAALGDYYKVSGAGTIGGVDYAINDSIIYNGTGWDKIDSTDAVTSVAGRVGAVVLAKGDVGLGSVDNTADIAKPISTTQQAALDDKAPIAHVGSGGSAHAAASVTVNGFMSAADKTKLDAITGTNTGDETLATIKSKLGITTLSGSNTGDQVIPTTLPASDVYAWAKSSVKPSYTPAEVGLGNVNNTADVSKPVSTAQQAALDGKAPLTGGGTSGTWPIGVTGNAATSDWVRTNANLTYGASGFQYFTSSAMAGNNPGTNNGPTADWYHIFRGNHSDAAGYYVDMALGLTDSSMWYRRIAGGTAFGWYRVLDSGNYNSYSPTLTGGGASGTWGINITGNAGTASGAGSLFGPASANGSDGWFRSTGDAGWFSSTYAVGIYATEAGNVRTYNGANFIAAGNVTAYSDETLKTNWRNLPPEFVERLAKVKHGIYDRIDTEFAKTQVGVSAQSLRELMPDAILEDSKGILSVAYGNAALAACVELAKECVELRARIAQLEAKQ